MDNLLRLATLANEMGASVTTTGGGSARLLEASNSNVDENRMEVDDDA